eukprot:TRINITY_DN60849_c0_g1_i1.p1 TRINITY_DN60849_c0_g1~~TRINITY_DN60849_c0_g1_i1.p1  ORF type:complete len:149 (-),score=11.73 TRINITY_DN60849_c0_g1_i1:165-611(-)
MDLEKEVWSVLLLSLCTLFPVEMVMECMSGKEIDCFECNSWEDPRCHDPFNFTASAGNMPKIVQCEGCCVKLVRDRGKELESVRRTCTDAIDINLFMVDHVCMTEGGRGGHMCFCEEDRCNGVEQVKQNCFGGIALISTSIRLFHNFL